MDVNRLERRNSSLDVIRIVAVYTVLSVHFFLHNGFYSEPISGYGPIEGLINFFTTGDYTALHGPQMFIMVMMRTLFGVCVPLFMILTGYLMSKKTLSRSYYKGIRKTLIIFVLATIACMIFKSVHRVPEAREAFYNFNLEAMFSAIKNSGEYTWDKFLLKTFDFTGADYSWYIEMYIGLFLIAPFLNLAYNKLKNQRQKQVLVFTFIFLTTIPSVFNIFNFETATWWTTPTESDSFQKFIPSFWMGIYPITYYFTGAYLREYGMKLRTRSVAGLFAASLFLFTCFNWFRSYGGGFKTGTYNYWYGFTPFVLSVLLFVMLSRIKSENWNLKVKYALCQVSDAALGIYLLSFIFDSLIYEVLCTNVPVMVDRLPYYFITVPLCFVLSALLSFLLNLLEKVIVKLYYRIKQIVIEQRAMADKRKWQDFLFVVLLALGVIFAFWKCTYGFGGNDEAFYLSIPHRLTLGDALFSDEWHLSQLSSFLLFPFVWLYTTITGSTEGIVLAARILYILVHTAAAFVIYTRLRKFGYISVFACFLYFIYTPYDIMALSYDSMGLELVILAGVLIATADYSKKLLIIFSGLAFAGAVLCNPYLAICYPLFAVCVIVHYIFKTKNTKFVLKSEMFSLRTFLFFTLGVGILAVFFLVFTLTRVSLGEIIENLPYMLKDPEHPQISIWDKIQSYFRSIFECHPHFKYALYAYAAMLLAVIIDRKRRLHRSVYLIITTAIVIFTQILFLPNLHSSTYNHIMFPLIFIGITSYILCENKPRELFAGLFVFGILYSICIHMTSNQYFYVISMALTASNIASYVFLAQLIREMREKPDNITYAAAIKQFSFVFAALMVILQGSFQIGSKSNHVFWDGSPDDLTSKIEAGPASGLYTTAANADNYNRLYTDLIQYKSKYHDNILCLTNTTWCYLALDDFGYGTFSSWLSGENSNTLLRLKEYYELNPDKIPSYIYIPKDSKWDIAGIITEAQAGGYTLSENTVSYQLERAN